ncbi:hypothetical protein DyAD56_23545 [Dyella sp. AD56]|nr:hypothetical protein DyAD56_23545 [Dyella sp. AD56]
MEGLREAMMTHIADEQASTWLQLRQNSGDSAFQVMGVWKILCDGIEDGGIETPFNRGEIVG